MPKRPHRPRERVEQPLNKDIHQWKFQAASTKYVLESMAILNAAQTATRQEYLEMMLEMDGKYPGRGWRQVMDELHKFYFARGLSLKEHARYSVGEKL